MASCVICQASAVVWCKNDEAMLCEACDAKLHSPANPLAARHARVRVCELCHAHPSAVFCKQDAAHLCSGCDAQAHPAHNPLAARHERVPVEQMELTTSSAECDSAESAPTALQAAVVPPAVELPAGQPIDKDSLAKELGFDKELEGFELDNSWLDRLDMGFDFTDILSEAPSDGLVPTLSDSEVLDGMVPSFGEAPPAPAVPSAAAVDAAEAEFSRRAEAYMSALMPSAQQAAAPQQLQQVPSLLAGGSPFALPELGLMQAAPSFASYQQQLAAMVPAAPLMVPAAAQLALAPAPRQPLPLAQQPQLPPAAAGVTLRSSAASAASGSSGRLRIVRYGDAAGESLSRAERVARYREKRKSRRFGKVVRYASRKAYAEARPRIKGRFATKEEVEALKAAQAAMNAKAGGGPGAAAAAAVAAFNSDLVVPVL